MNFINIYVVHPIVSRMICSKIANPLRGGHMSRFQSIKLTVYVSLFLLGATAAQAAQVTVTGTFTSFTSWIFDPTVRDSVVNGTLLTSSGTIVGNNGAINYYLSNTLNFSAPTTSISFSYGAAGFTPPFPLVNAMGFSPGGDNVVAGQNFTLGTFSYTNGQWYPQADIGFVLTSHSSDSSLDQHTFSGTLRLISTSGAGVDPFAEADYFYVVERPDLGSARVFEQFIQPAGNPGYTGDFAFTGYIGSLVPTGFVALNSAGFTNSSVDPALSVPEPSSYAMLLAGLGLLGWVGRCRKQPATQS